MILIPRRVDSGSGTQDQIRFAGLSQEDNNFRSNGVDATGINHQFQKEPARLQFSTESIGPSFVPAAPWYSADMGGSPRAARSTLSRNRNEHVSTDPLMSSSGTARSMHASSTPHPFHRSKEQLWVSFGGPAVRNKLFFFTTYEAIQQVFDQQTTGLVPSEAFRAKALQKSPSLAPS